MAFTAITALVSGTAVGTAAVLAAVANVGAIMSVVGVVTGSKSLAKLGSVLGLVGGVGGLAYGATSAAATANAATSAASPTAWNAAGIAGSDTFAATAGLNAGATGAGGLVGNASNSIGAIGGQVAATPTATSPLTSAASNPTTLYGPQGVGDVGKQFTAGASSLDVADPGDSFFGSLWQGIKDPANKELVNAGVKVIGGALQGANEADKFNQQMGFAQAQFADAQAQRANVTNGQNASKSGIIQRATA